MDWTAPGDIRLQIERYWSSGRLLAGGIRFPLSLPLRRPGVKALCERFDEVRKWIRKLEEGRGSGYEIEWSEVNHRLLGRNRVPARAVIATEADALRLIGKLREAERFRAVLCATEKECRGLAGWVGRKPLAALENANDWTRLLAVVNWFQAHPRSGLYLRQLDIPGVDTKFIETRRGLISQLLDEVLPPVEGAQTFEERYGLAPKPRLVRLRILDPRLYIQGLSDITLRVDECSRLDLPLKRVFVTENEINGVAFPAVPESAIFFGSGYRIEQLAAIAWLRALPLYYWGDIDTHGFAILDRFRGAYPQVESFLMDRATLLAHHPLWVREEDRHEGELSHLTRAERALYDDLRFDRLGDGVRLEQERIPFERIRGTVTSIPEFTPAIEPTALAPR